MVWKEYEAICEKLIETNQEQEKDSPFHLSYSRKYWES